MTRTQKSLRALFLTALMIGSVFAGSIAFSGAAAANHSGNGSHLVQSTSEITDPANNTIQAYSGVQTQSFDISYDVAANSELDFTVDFSEAVNAGAAAKWKMDFSDDAVTSISDNGVTNIDAEKNDTTSGDEKVRFNITNSGSSDVQNAVTISVKLNTDEVTDLDTRLSHTVSGENSQPYELYYEFRSDGSTVITEESKSDIGTVYYGETVTYITNETDTAFNVTDENGQVINQGTTSPSDRNNLHTEDLSAGMSYTVNLNTSNDLNSTTFELKELGLSVEDSSAYNNTTTSVNVTTDIGYGDSITAWLESKPGGGPDWKFSKVDNTTKSDTLSGSSGDTAVSFDVNGLNASKDYQVVVKHDDSELEATGSLEINEGTQPTPPQPPQPSDGNASFEDSGTPAVGLGNIHQFTINLEDNWERYNSTVAIENGGYEVLLNVTDQDNDSNVAIRFNTYVAGNLSPNTFTAVSGNDTVEVKMNSEVTGMLDTGTYNLWTKAGNHTWSEMGSPSDSDPNKTQSLQIEPRPDQNLSHTVHMVSYYSDFFAMMENDNLPAPDSTAAVWRQGYRADYVVHQLHAEGIWGAWANASGSDANEKFLSLYQSGDISLTVAGDEANTEPNQDPRELNITDTLSNGGAAVRVNESTQDLYLIVGTQLASARYDRPTEQNTDQPDIGDIYHASFSVDDGNSGFSDAGSEMAQYELVEASASLKFDGNRQLFEGLDEVTVEGESNYAVGQYFNITLTDEANNHINGTAVYAAANGSISATFNLSDVDPGTEVTIELTNASRTVVDTNKALLEPEADASVTYDGFESSGASVSTVTIDSVNMSSGGFVAIHKGSASGEVIGHSNFIGAGTTTDINIALEETITENTTLVAMPHFDTNGNFAYEFDGGSVDTPYSVNGSIVTDSGNVTFLPGPPAKAEVTYDGRMAAGDSVSQVTVDSVNMSEGGFIAIHNGSASSEVIGHSGYLGAGLQTNVSITLNTTLTENTTLVAMPHLDTNGDFNYEFDGGTLDGPYTDPSGAVVDSGEVTFEPEPPMTASVSFTGVASSDSSVSQVTVDSVNMSSGGFVAIHEGSASGDVIGHTNFIAAGEATDINVALDQTITTNTTLVAMAHMDTNDDLTYEFTGGSLDAPYTSGGSAVVASGDVTVQPADSGDGDTTTTTSPPEDTTSDDSENNDSDNSSDEDTDSGGTPGMTMSIALVALVAAALLAVRRNN